MFHEIRLNKCVIYLTSDEIHKLLLNDIELYKEALKRGKIFTRSNSLNSRIAQKRSEG
jgi:hypothetical protein